MKGKKLKPVVKKTIIVSVLVLIVTATFALLTNQTSTVAVVDDNFIYVNDYIFDSYYPVVNNEEKVVRPYTSSSVTIHKNFYEKDESKENQEKSIIYHEGIYMQNSGVDYTSSEQFDVIASFSGTVTNITDDALLGKTIEIRNSTELIVMYQSLGEVLVKKGDSVLQGQVIAKSGTCPLNSDIKQGLHFEMYKNGTLLNPEKTYDQTVKSLLEN